MSDSDTVQHIDVTTLKERLDNGDELLLLDVREDEELQFSKLDGIVHIPMGDLADRVEELDKQAEVICICRSGGRSLNVAHYLSGQGFGSVYNLTGGMNEYARIVDPSQSVY